MPTERRRPRRAGAGLFVDARARRVVRTAVCRVTSPYCFAALSSLRLFDINRSRRRRSRASVASRASRRAAMHRRRPRPACVDLVVIAPPRRCACSLSIGASAGDAERAPRRERVVVPTEHRRRPRPACAGLVVDARALRVVRAAVCRVTLPRLSSSSHRRLGSVRAGTGGTERAPSRERDVVTAKRHRPCGARVGMFVDARVRPVIRAAACQVIPPRLPSSSHRWFSSVRAGAGGAERALSRDHVVVPTERRRPCRARADLVVGARAHRVVRAAVCRVTSPRLPSSSCRPSAAADLVRRVPV